MVPISSEEILTREYLEHVRDSLIDDELKAREQQPKRSQTCQILPVSCLTCFRPGDAPLLAYQTSRCPLSSGGRLNRENKRSKVTCTKTGSAVCSPEFTWWVDLGIKRWNIFSYAIAMHVSYPVWAFKQNILMASAVIIANDGKKWNIYVLGYLRKSRYWWDMRLLFCLIFCPCHKFSFLKLN